MRILCAVGLVASIATAPAFAADMPAKAPAVDTFSWTGCYIGAHLGGAQSQDTLTTTPAGSTNYGSTGLVGGAQFGCDYQFDSRWVVGGEGRFAGTTLRNTITTINSIPATGQVFPAHLNLKNDVLASITARLGYRFAERWLGYVRGGLGVTHEKADDAFTIPGGVTADPTGFLTRTGWTVGAGMDWAFAPNWSANVEYNYYDFGSNSMSLSSTQNSVQVILPAISLKDTIHAVTTGVNYHF